MEKDPVGRLQAVLADRYRIDRELGRGGFATVYQVWNLRLDRAEALKVLAPGHEADEEFSRRFMQEVRLAASLEHPSIVKVYDFAETGGVFWYSMQLVTGRTLTGEMRERGPFSAWEAARIAIPLLDALDYSHSRGIVHRDLKPENVILDHDGRPFLMDFGIAKTAGSLVKTQTGFLLGTPAYVAPEQAQGKHLDGRADQYALGVTLYKTVSARFPFEAKDPLEAVILRLTQPPRPLAEARPGIDPAFAAIVMRALEREPERRFASARAMRDALSRYLAGKDETSATIVTSPEKPWPEAREEAEDVPSDATVLSPMATPTLVSPGPPSRPPVTSALGAPSRRSFLVPVSAGFVVVLFALGATALVVLRSRDERPGGPAAALPTAAPAPRGLAAGAPPALAVPATAVPATATVPVSLPAPTASPLRVVRPTSPPEPSPAAPSRPVTLPERLTPDPPFAGAPPAACSGAAVTVGFSVDAEGGIVAPRLFPSDAPPECGHFVLEALPGWKWRPAVDAAGAPVPSRRLVVFVRLP